METTHDLRTGLHACTAAVAHIGRQLALRVADPARPGAVSNDALHACGDEVFAFARLHATTVAVGALLDLADARHTAGRVRQLWRFAASRGLLDVRAGFVRAGVTASQAPVYPAHVEAALAEATGPAAVQALAPWLLDGGAWSTDAYALDDDHADVRAVFRDFADAEVAPLAESIHRHDAVLPETLLKAYADLGALGITIPERYGGQFVDTRAMALATEELARASLGAGGSVITRPEIASKALLKGGTEEQKRRWLPRIARGQDVVAIAVTEPAAGSDVAAVRVQALRDGDGWRLRGEKTWCTFAGRASLLLVLARTGTTDAKAKGLTLFLAEKPPVVPPADDRSFAFEDGHRSTAYPAGGKLAGRAIPTIGYRGMHSFTVFFEDWYVPDANRIGADGEGFALQMAGFAGGRIQTAARAVGVMEAALRAAVRYTQDRSVFGRRLSDLALTRRTLVEMAASVALCRQMTYATCDKMDRGHGDLDASLVKLLACRTAEDVTREAMQLHGGMGYSEEYAVSRYWQDARVLSIFEGAEEVLAVMVVGRTLLRGVLAGRG
ncbi:MAG: acyl-CoA dehydrogenase [Myxococcales bacterium]|nr:acyl-CoA dehydrogenase [Myxococcales bacterium]